MKSRANPTLSPMTKCKRNRNTVPESNLDFDKLARICQGFNVVRRHTPPLESLIENSEGGFTKFVVHLLFSVFCLSLLV